VVEFGAENVERLRMDPKVLALFPGGRKELQNPETLFPLPANGGNFVID
jgi:hypothetical protein